MLRHGLIRQMTLCLGLVARASAAGAEDVPPAHYPALPREAQSAQGFAPKGWIVEHSATGDLDGRAGPDLVFILRDTDPAKILPREFAVEPLDTNPRILAVALARGKTFRLALANHTLIRRQESASVFDPFAEGGELTVANRSFTVPLEFFATIGSWTTYRNELSFRYRRGKFVLDRFRRESLVRNTGKTQTVTADYRAGTLRVVTGSNDSERTATIRKRLRGPAPTIEAVGDGLGFDPEAAARKH
ncbi:hypothetical protein [Mangrovicella endophytica]|uniref:hypothetical protein n=1 Tax=Mangrovicella endophytica TaxID=2066697 RepID=UPI000C9DA79E|nr:hypothetical protein [Mangrovicella endophytica]